MSKKNVLTHARKAKADALALANRLDEACALYEAVCRADRLDVEAWVKLSITQRRLARLVDAERCARQALTLQPKLAPAHYALGAALHSQGRPEAAVEAYQRALALKPDFADAHYLLATALQDLGRTGEALVAYRRAIALRPNYVEALCDLGAALITAGETAEAATCLQRSLALKPHSVEALCNLASLMQLNGRLADARATLEQALHIDPASPEALGSLAALLERTGETEASRALTERGLARMPNDPALNLVAARLARRDKRLQDAVVLLERAHTQRPALGGEIQLLLGQLWDELGDAGRAWPCLVEGKRLLAQASPSGEAERARYWRTADAISHQCNAELVRSVTDRGPRDAPVFLIGFPRSGTTLLEQILDSHPAIQTLEEKPTVAAMVEAFQAWAGDRPDALAGLTAEQIARLRELYFAAVDRCLVRQPGAVVVDKLPLNTVFVPLIWRVFPRARFILAIRHPCDVCLSCFMQSFATNAGMANFFSLDDAAQAYARVMGGWRGYAQVLPLEYHRVRYEDLVADVPGVARGLLDFLGVDWDAAVLAHVEHARSRGPIRTPSYHQVTQPVYQHAVQRWTRYAAAFEPVRPSLQPFIDAFGYTA